MSIFHSNVYSSINESGDITNLFFVNISNLLYTRSGVRNLNKILKKEVVNRMVAETKLKQVYIERFNETSSNEIFETVMDIQDLRNNEDRPNVYYSSAIFADQEKDKKSSFKRVKNINFINSDTTKVYAFKDFLSNSSLKDNFNYRIELIFTDGMYIFLDNILKSFKRFLESLDQIKTISENDRLLLQSGSYNLTKFNKKGLPNAIALDQTLIGIVGFYFDVLNLIKNTNFGNINLPTLKTEEFGKIGFVSGKHEYFIEFYSKFTKLHEYIRSTADETIKDIQNLGSNKPRRGVKSNSRKTNSREISLDIISNVIDHRKTYDGALNYLTGNSNDTEMITVVTRQNLLNNITIDQVDGGILKKAQSFIKRGKNTLITNNIEAIINIANSNTKSQTTKAVPSYEESQDIHEDQADLLMNTVNFLTSNGISIETAIISNHNKNIVNNTTKTEEYTSFEDNINQNPDLTLFTDYYTDIESVKYADIPQSVVEIAKNLVFNDCFTNKEQKPVYSNLQEIFDPSMMNKIEYLSGFETAKSSYESFVPSWKPLTSATFNNLGTGGYLICRNMNRTNNPLTNYISINEYFLLYLG